MEATMHWPSKLAFFLHFARAFSVPQLLAAGSSQCKSTPQSLDRALWDSLNITLGGRLIEAVAPAGVCHPGQPNFNNTTCSSLLPSWISSWTFHAKDPVSNAFNNWNNDSCLPLDGVSCSISGYPVFVVNATTAEHVQAGVDFARKHNIRLNVKATGV